MGSLRFGRYALRACAAAVALALLSSLQVYAEQGSYKDRQLLAIAVADYIHDRDFGSANPFGSSAVELGAAAVERPWALAEWRSEDRKTQGKVLFGHRCDRWNVVAVSAQRGQLQRIAMPGVPAATAGKLIAELADMQDQKVGYLKATPGPAC